MLKDTQQIVDILDKEIKDADRELRETLHDYDNGYVDGLLRAQTIFLENIHLPF